MWTIKRFYKYQWEGFWFVVQRAFCGLFLDMGLGKTVIMLSVIKHLKHIGALKKPVLIVAPVRVIHNVWAQEAAKWRHTRSLRFSLVHGNQKERMAALNEIADVYLINPEGLKWLLELLDNRKAKENWPFSWLVIDESSKFKAAGTKRFRKLRHMVRLFNRRTILTGTPTPNSLLDLWAQVFIVDEGERLGPSYERYKDRYFYQADYQGYDIQPRNGCDDEIMEAIGDCMLRMEAEGVPPVIYNDVAIDLPPAARRHYEELEEEMFLELEAGSVEALNAASLSGRCHQLANGAIYVTDEEGAKVWTPVHDAKIEALQDIIDETGSPVIVTYNFKHDLARLRAAFPKAPVLGDAKKLGATIKGWQQNRYPVLLAHPANAAHGLDGLQHGNGHTIVFFSLTWSREQHDQLIARIGGARGKHAGKKNIVVHYIRARDTVDDAIMLSGQRKDRTQRGLLNALKEYRRVRQTNA
jgi:SNF2 family DNA or RNA helicase